MTVIVDGKLPMVRDSQILNYQPLNRREGTEALQIAIPTDQ